MNNELHPNSYHMVSRAWFFTLAAIFLGVSLVFGYFVSTVQPDPQAQSIVGGAQTTVRNAPSCVESEVLAFVNANASDGDTIVLPACSPTNWTTTFAPNVGIMLQGQPCTIGPSGKTDANGREIMIPTSCPTNIVDAVVGDADLIRIPVPPCDNPCSYQVGMRHISFTSTGQRTYAQSGVFGFNGSGNIVEDGRRVKLEYLRIVGITGNAALLFRVSEWGVASHLYIQTPQNIRQIVFYHIQGGSSYSMARADQRLTSTSLFGREDSWTIEDSVAILSCSVYTNSPFTDTVSSGARLVVRNNYLEGYNIQTHGIESGWMRGPHYMEVFGNKMQPCEGAIGQEATMLESRTGGVLQWNNVMSAAFAPGTPAAHLKVYRLGGASSAYDYVSGHAAVDQNDPANPLVTCTTTASTNTLNYSTVTCAGVNWAINEHQGKIIHQPWPACRERTTFTCASSINSNTSNTLTFRPNMFDGPNRQAPGSWPGAGTLNLNPNGGDVIHIDGVISTLDSPCRTGGAQFGPSGSILSITMNGEVATLTTYPSQPLTSLGIVSGNYVSIENPYYIETSDYNNRPYSGTYQVTVTGPNTFTYTPRRVPAGSSSAGGELKKVLVNSSNQTSACYEFLNFNAQSAPIHFGTSIPSGGGKFMDLRVSGVDPNPVVFNYVGNVQTSQTSPFNGTVGVGVGTAARRPSSCTSGVFYWATDEGEWDSTNGSTPDGRGYKCTSTNSWILYYTPYPFPHPMVSGAPPPSPTPTPPTPTPPPTTPTPPPTPTPTPTPTVPTINSITPDQVTSNVTTTLTVNGSNFVSNFSVFITTPAGRFSLSPAALTYVSSSQVKAQVTMGDPASNQNSYSATLAIATTGLTPSGSAQGNFTVNRQTSPLPPPPPAPTPVPTPTPVPPPSPTPTGPTVPAASCSLADVQAAINNAKNGDTVVIPAGTCTWTETLELGRLDWNTYPPTTIGKGITLQGAGCTFDADGRPTSCNTVIKDGVDSGDKPVINWYCAPNQAHRLSSIEFQEGGNTARKYSGIVNINCTNQGSTSFRMDHSKFLNVNARAFNASTAIGVFDHNTFEMTGQAGHFWGTNWYGPNGEVPPNPDWGDNSWTQPVTWGNKDFLYMEDNTLKMTDSNGCTDGVGGARFAFRFNKVTGCLPAWHGTDSGGRFRSTRAVEVYKNTFDETARPEITTQNRDGSGLFWGNTAVGIAKYLEAVSYLANYRGTFYSRWYGPTDGTSPADLNDPANPYFTGTSASVHVPVNAPWPGFAVTVNGANWQPDQWKDYVIRKTNCTNQHSPYRICFAPIQSNTNNTINYLQTQFGDLTFSPGDTLEINRIIATIDQPGRGGGGLVTTTGEDTPVFPPGWNNQVDFPSMQWLNTNDGRNLKLIPSTGTTHRRNGTYFNYEPELPFDGTLADSKSGIGVGTIASRPSSCTIGALYWATNEGEWDSTNGSSPDGRLYKCTAKNTWTVYYTPYVYPHPLVSGATIPTPPPSPTPPTPTPLPPPPPAPTPVPTPTPPPSGTLNLTYNGKSRDMVGQGENAIPDGLVDPEFGVTLQSSKTITKLVLSASTVGWDTVPGNKVWFLGATANGASPLLNSVGSNINITASIFNIYASDSYMYASDGVYSIYLRPGTVVTLTATFSDGGTAVGSATITSPVPTPPPPQPQPTPTPTPTPTPVPPPQPTPTPTSPPTSGSTLKTPTNLTATLISSSSVNLTWNAGIPDPQVVGYIIYRNGNAFAVSLETSFLDQGLSGGIINTYSVAAYDAYGNLSAQSTPISVSMLWFASY